jgi:putative transferase (TIGR04331 family)
MFLVTTANQNFWKTDEKILFLGEWCKIYNQKHIWSKLDYETVPSHWDEREKLNDRYVYLDNLSEKYLNSLASALNNTHREDHSAKYWRIILAPWLSVFIGVIYDRYLSIHSAINFNKVTHTWVAPLNFERWVPNDTLAFISKAYGDVNFNLYLYSQLITKLGKVSFEFKDDHAFTDLEDQARVKPLSISANIKVNIKSFLNKISSKIPDRYNQIVFSSSGFSFRNQLKLQILLGQIPYLGFPNVASSITPIEMDLRKNIKLPGANNEFEVLLSDLMVEQFPTDFLEGYSEMHNKSLDAFPKKPKVIFTSYDFAHNEGFKFWAATKIEKGAKLVIAQHGGGYGMGGPFVIENHEMKICDKYFTWGWKTKEETKIVPMAAPKISASKYNIKPDLKGTILWVTNTWPIYFLRIDHVTSGFSGIEYFHRQKRFLKVVNSRVFEKLIIRLFNIDFGWNEKERLAELDPTPKYYNRGTDSMLSQVKESRLCIHDYLGTAWLETLVINFPTVVFYDPSRVKTIESAQPYLDDLRRVNILHDSPESAAEFINKIYEDPMSWWVSSELQQVREKFCNQFARKSENWLEEWKEELLKMVR